MSQRALGSTHGYLRIDGSVGGGLSRAGHVRSWRCGGARRWHDYRGGGWPAVKLQLWSTGCSEGYGEAMGALNRYERHCVAGLPSRSANTVFWTRWRGIMKS